jgi:F-type H+-transporting ATPase subunit b
MRTRTRVLAGVVLAVGLVFGASSAAHAATDPQAEAKHCFEEQEAKEAAGQKADYVSCYKAPSPLLPATNEIIWGGIAFFITLLALWKFAYPGMKKGMEGRSERIRADLQAAEDARVEAEQLKAEYEQRLAAAKQEATRVIEDARGTADALKAELQQRAEAEIGEMRQRAAADVEAMKGQALADLQHEVAQIAIGAAEVVVEKNLDEATQRQLVENYINTVASRN